MMKKYIREPVNSLTHLAGAVLSLIALALMLYKGIIRDIGAVGILSILIFGISMFALYTTSGIYHLVIAKEKILLRLKKLDHSMIFVLIAGTYTPILTYVTQGRQRIVMLSLIWGIALAGVLFKIFWINAPRWFYTGIYLGMGWISVFMIGRIYAAMGPRGIMLLLAGGLSYTAGAVIYGMKKPDISRHFGFHELFHCFVLTGTFFHFLMVYTQVL